MRQRRHPDPLDAIFAFERGRALQLHELTTRDAVRQYRKQNGLGQDVPYPCWIECNCLRPWDKQQEDQDKRGSAKLSENQTYGYCNKCGGLM